MNSLFLELMQDIISLHSNCKLLTEEEHSFFMAYHYRDNIIKYNIQYLKINKLQIKEFNAIDDETFFEICLYHELGHYLDYQRNKERALIRKVNDDPNYNFQLIGEQNAWKYGREIIPGKILVYFDILNEYNLNFWKSRMTEG